MHTHGHFGARGAGTHEGCRELRTTNRHYILPGTCEFDGRFSLALHAGRLHLFARANLHPVGGARHVQLSRRDARARGSGSWGPFETLHFDGVVAGAAENNIYFLLPVAWRPSVLLGLFPAVLEGRGGGLFWSVSRDAIHWTEPVRLFNSTVSLRRTDDHPVGMRCHGAVCVLQVEHGVATVGSMHSRCARARITDVAVVAVPVCARVASPMCMRARLPART